MRKLGFTLIYQGGDNNGSYYTAEFNKILGEKIKSIFLKHPFIAGGIPEGNEYHIDFAYSGVRLWAYDESSLPVIFEIELDGYRYIDLFDSNGVYALDTSEPLLDVARRFLKEMLRLWGTR